jgi:hypothetical protein
LVCACIVGGGGIRNFGEKEKDYIFFTLDALIRDVKNRKQYAV